MSKPIFLKSSSFKPRVVRAGLPRRIPLVINGDLSSNGTPFLLHVIPASSKRLAASYSCKAAVKAGDPLTEEEMRALVDQLFATENPFYCPHGRPIIINLTIDELDKRFERH